LDVTRRAVVALERRHLEDASHCDDMLASIVLLRLLPGSEFQLLISNVTESSWTSWHKLRSAVYKIVAFGQRNVMK
jgi:hypothetical protein